MNLLKTTVLLTLLSTLMACGGPKIQELTVRPLANQMKFMNRELKASAGSEIKLTFQNTATMEGMVHNLVLLKVGADADEIARNAIGAENFEVKSDQVIAQTAYLKPGEQGELIVTITTPGRYEYICTYPGHYPSMKGVLIIK